MRTGRTFLALLVAGWLVCAAPLGATITVGAHGVAGADSGHAVATTSALNFTGATGLVACVSELGDGSSGGTTTVTDSSSNTWTSLTAHANATDGMNQMRMWYVQAPTVTGSQTVTATSSVGSYPSIAVVGLNGAHLSSFFDQQNGNAATIVTSHQPGSVTPSTSNEVVIECLSWAQSGTTVAIDGGFTIQDQLDLSGFVNYGIALATLVQTTATAANPTWSWGGGSEDGIASAAGTFRTSASAPCQMLLGIFRCG